MKLINAEMATENYGHRQTLRLLFAEPVGTVHIDLSRGTDLDTIVTRFKAASLRAAPVTFDPVKAILDLVDEGTESFNAEDTFWRALLNGLPHFLREGELLTAARDAFNNSVHDRTESASDLLQYIDNRLEEIRNGSRESF